MVPSSRRSLTETLGSFDRLLEVGIGDRPEVARALAARGRDVVAVDVDDSVVGAVTSGEIDEDRDGEGNADRAGDDDRSGSLRVRRGDVVALADAVDPLTELVNEADVRSIDAVYGLNLPAELQRPALRLAERLDAVCLFTTLGFEEPVVPVTRRSLPDETLYVAHDPSEPGPRR